MNGSGMASFERDEWIRRLRTALRQQNTARAFSIVVYEIFGSAAIPSTISRFTPHRLTRQSSTSPGDQPLNTAGGNAEAVERLNHELQLLRASSSATSKLFLVNQINNDMFLWTVRLLYDPSLPFAQDLVEFYKKANGSQFAKMIRYWRSGGKHAVIFLMQCT